MNKNLHIVDTMGFYTNIHQVCEGLVDVLLKNRDTILRYVFKTPIFESNMEKLIAESVAEKTSGEDEHYHTLSRVRKGCGDPCVNVIHEKIIFLLEDMEDVKEIEKIISQDLKSEEISLKEVSYIHLKCIKMIEAKDVDGFMDSLDWPFLIQHMISVKVYYKEDDKKYKCKDTPSIMAFLKNGISLLDYVASKEEQKNLGDLKIGKKIEQRLKFCIELLHSDDSGLSNIVDEERAEIIQKPVVIKRFHYDYAGSVNMITDAIYQLGFLENVRIKVCIITDVFDTIELRTSVEQSIKMSNNMYCHISNNTNIIISVMKYASIPVKVKPGDYDSYDKIICIFHGINTKNLSYIQDMMSAYFTPSFSNNNLVSKLRFLIITLDEMVATKLPVEKFKFANIPAINELSDDVARYKKQGCISDDLALIRKLNFI